jgi:hypothetical protein
MSNVAVSSINLVYLKCSEKIETFIISDVYRSFQCPLESLLILFRKKNILIIEENEKPLKKTTLVTT